MERTYYILSILVFYFNGLIAQPNYKSIVYKSYVTNQMEQWKKAIDEMQALPVKSNNQTLELLNYQYGYVAWCIGNDLTEQAETYLEKALNNLETLEKQYYKPALLYSYKAAFWGFKIGLSKYKAVFLGPESISFAQKAVDYDKTNYFGYVQLGNIDYYMPAVFGGSKSKALSYYLQAEKLFKSQNSHLQDWNYLSLLVTIAQAYSEAENYAQARYYYEKILNIEPEFGWVKNELLPEMN